MSKGFSFGSFGAVIGRGRKTLYRWVDEFEDFAEAKEIAHEKAKYFFEKKLIAKISGDDSGDELFDSRKIDNACLIFALKTRFKDEYSEKVESDELKENHLITLAYPND